jgi:hypothetical protein
MARPLLGQGMRRVLPPLPEPATPPARIGHNGGPPLDPGESFRHFVWKKKVKQAWRAPPEIALRRLARAEALGMTYRAYTLEILERGRYL